MACGFIIATMQGQKMPPVRLPSAFTVSLEIRAILTGSPLI